MEFLIVAVETNQSFMQHILKAKKNRDTLPIEIMLNGFRENLRLQEHSGERCRLQLLTLVFFYQLLVEREAKLIQLNELCRNKYASKTHQYYTQN